MTSDRGGADSTCFLCPLATGKEGDVVHMGVICPRAFLSEGCLTDRAFIFDTARKHLGASLLSILHYPRSQEHKLRVKRASLLSCTTPTDCSAAGSRFTNQNTLQFLTF